jgi:hypothetical protein
VPRGNPAIKLAITVDADVHAAVTRAAQADRVSLSKRITDAARDALLVRRGLAAVAAWEKEHGALTAKEMRAAHARVEREHVARRGKDRTPMKRVLYDTGVLIAAERGDRRVWAEHRARLERGMITIVATPVLAQVSGSQRQAELRRFLTGCEAAPLLEPTAHRAGALLGKSRPRTSSMRRSSPWPSSAAQTS